MMLSSRWRRAASATVTCVLAAAIAAGCGSDDTSENKNDAAKASATASIDFGDSKVLAESGVDPDAVIDQESGRVYVSWVTPSGDHAPAEKEEAATDEASAEDSSESEEGGHDGGDAEKEGAEGEKSMGHGTAPKFDLMLAYSDDSGETFSDPVRVNDVEGDVFAGSNTKPKVLPLEGEQVLVSWTRKRDYPGQDYGQSTVRAAVSDDGGDTFGNARDVINDGVVTSESYQELHQLEDGSVIAVVLDYRGSFEKPAREGIGARLATWKAGSDWFAKSTEIDAMTCECCDNAFTMTKDGKLLLAYRDQVDEGGDKPIRDSAVRSSTDGGVTWSDPVKLGDDGWEFDQCPESGPDMTTDEQGRVHAVYFTGVEGRPGVYYSTSDDDADSFEATKLATDDFFPPSNMDIAPLEDGAIVAWDDSREDDPQVGVAFVEGGEIGEVDEAWQAGSLPVVDAEGDFAILAWTNPDKGVSVVTRGALEGAPGTATESASQEPANEQPVEPKATTFEATIASGQPKGGPQVWRAKKGDRVRITVTSDTADELHLHGYDVSKDVAANGTATLELVADTTGSFELELEDAGTLIGNLEVR